MKKIRSISISIEWVKNRVWGLNPHCKFDVVFDDYSNEIAKSKASGWGYDKELKVIAMALNKSNYFQSLLKELEIERNCHYYWIYPFKNKYFITDGGDKNCFIETIGLAGLKLITENHTRLSDYYYFE